MIYIETERLILRDWQEKDIPYLVKLNQDPDVMRYFPTPKTEEQCVRFYHEMMESLAAKSFGSWVVEDKDTGEFVGFTGLREAHFDAYFTPCVEIGWRLLPQYWNKGYASEAASACLDYAFNTLALEKVYSFTAAINHASETVMKKIGMLHVGEFEMPTIADGHELKHHVLYVLRK